MLLNSNMSGRYLCIFGSDSFFCCFDNTTVNDVILNQKQREYTLLITFKNIMKRVTNQVMLCEIMSHVH